MMKAIKKFFHELYSSGNPIFINGYWHIEWQTRGGFTKITSFGWKERERAEQHIAVIMAGR